MLALIYRQKLCLAALINRSFPLVSQGVLDDDSVKMLLLQG